MKAKIVSWYNIKPWLVLILICVVLLLPARFYQSFSLSLFNVKSNLNVNYINVVDLFVFLISFICMLFSGGINLSRKQIFIFFAYFIIVVACAFGLIIIDESAFIGELMSKLLLLFSSLIIGNYILNNFSNKQLILVYLIPLIILIVSSFFLNNYESYGETRRVGTIGFGSNETAMFACIFIFILLFKRKFSIFLKILLLGICFASLFVVASRRGIIIASFFVLVKAISVFFSFGSKINLRKLFTAFLAIGFFLVLLFLFRDRIRGFLSSSALFLRFEYSLDSTNYFSLEDRVAIFKDGLNFFSDNPLIGSFGSDTFYAQGVNTHAHNLFIQVFVTYGFIFGLPILCFLVGSLIKACFWCVSKTGREGPLFVPCSFLIVTFICEQVGYVFWNPKAFFWLALTLTIINEKVYSNVLDKNSKRVEGNRDAQICNGFLYR